MKLEINTVTNMKESNYPVFKPMCIFPASSLLSLRNEPEYGSPSDPGPKSLFQQTGTSSVGQILGEDCPRKIPCFSSSAKAIAILNECAEWSQYEDELKDGGIYDKCDRKEIEDIPNRYPHVTYSSKALTKKNESSNTTEIRDVSEDTPGKLHCFSRSSKALAILNETYSMEENSETSGNMVDLDKKAKFHGMSGQRDKNKIVEISFPENSVEYPEAVKIQGKNGQKRDSHLKEVKRALDFDFLDDTLDHDDISYHVKMFTERNEDLYSKGLSLRPEDNEPFSDDDFQRYINNPLRDSDISDEFDPIILGDPIRSHEIYAHNAMNIPNVTMDVGYFDEDNRSTCNICTKSFVKKSDFTLHIKMHVMLPYQCKSCDECCLTAELMEDHVAVAHSMVKRDVVKKEMLRKRKSGIGTLKRGTENKTLTGLILKNKTSNGGREKKKTLTNQYLSEKPSEKRKLRKAELKQEVKKEKKTSGEKFEQKKMKHQSHRKETYERKMMRDKNIAHGKVDLDIFEKNGVKNLAMGNEVVKRGDVRRVKAIENTVNKEEIWKQGSKRRQEQKEGFEEKLKNGTLKKDHSKRESEKGTLEKSGIIRREVGNEIKRGGELTKGTINKEASGREEKRKGLKKETIQNGSVKTYSNEKKIPSKQKPPKPDITKNENIESKNKPFKCDTCGKKYPKHRHLKKNEFNKHNQKPHYICEHCKKFFKLHSFYKRHLQCHNKPRNFVCGTCDSTYTCRSHLSRHLIKHTGLRSFQCHVCSKTYTRNDQLTVHLRTHSDVAPYHCSQCHKRFNRSDQFQLHLRRHDGVKPFQCVGCKFAFCQKSDMNRHVKRCTKVQKE